MTGYKRASRKNLHLTGIKCILDLVETSAADEVTARCDRSNKLGQQTNQSALHRPTKNVCENDIQSEGKNGNK